MAMAMVEIAGEKSVCTAFLDLLTCDCASACVRRHQIARDMVDVFSVLDRLPFLELFVGFHIVVKILHLWLDVRQLRVRVISCMVRSGGKVF